MKKSILMGLLVVPTILMAQTQEPIQVNETRQFPVLENTANDLSGTNPGVVTTPSTDEVKLKAQPYQFIKIGETYYDLQSNNSLGNRIILHSDGTISAVWTTSPDAGSTSFPNRGAGYNYYDGSAWGSVVNSRIESSRTGWPTIGLLGNGNVYTIAHDASTGGFKMMSGPKDGSNWQEAGPILDDETVVGEERAPIWAKTASSGDNIYMVSTYTSSGVNSEVTRGGVDNPILYSRSTDNGATWTVENALLPGYDSTLYSFGSAEVYDIVAKDSVVAIVIGLIAQPVMMWKSVDYGVTFTLTDVDNLPYKGTNRANWPFTDTLVTCDGSLEIILDNDLDAHIFYGGTRGYRGLDQAGDSGTFFMPWTAFVMHWTEGMAEPQVCASATDRNGDGVLNILPATYAFLDGNGNVPSNVITVARYGNNCLATQPSASIGADGTVYLVYSLAIEETISDLEANYRDVMVTFSTDDGNNWAASQNITQDDWNEHVFCFAAETADDNLHLVWQKDDIPGTNLQNHSELSANHPVVRNDILYGAIPTSAIKNGDIGPHTASAENVEKPAEVFFVSQSYPNPNDGNAKVTIFLLNSAEVTIEVTDMYGKVVNSGNVGMLGAGNHIIDIDASQLASGMYFYTISTPEHSMTKKMQVH